MVETRPSHSSDDLARRLDAIPDDPADTMFGLNQLSTMRLLQDHGSPFHVVSARFTGDLPADHEIGVRAATMVLGEFQEIISEVGAALKRESPRRGPLPAGILEATELRFAPQVLPGSVIFTLHPAREAVLFESGHSPLDDALTSIFSLFEKVERPASNSITSPLGVADALREFGPRAARHLVKFASALDQSGLNVDLGVMAAGRPARASRVSRAGARFLRSLAEKATSRTTDIELVGGVHNLGTDNKHRFKDDTRGRITMTADAEVTAVLLRSFDNARVRVSASETQSVNIATGATSYRFHATGAEILEA